MRLICHLSRIKTLIFQPNLFRQPPRAIGDHVVRKSVATDAVVSFASAHYESPNGNPVTVFRWAREPSVTK